MNLQNITIQEVDFDLWLKRRMASGVRAQKPYVYPDRRIGYGLIVDPLEFKSFVDVFENLSADDKWVGGLSVENRDSAASASGGSIFKDYSQKEINLMLRGKMPVEREELMSLLERADKISFEIDSPFRGIAKDHLYFRKNGSSVYSATIRTGCLQLDRFSYWGFQNPTIFMVKADLYPKHSKTKQGEVSNN